MSYTLTTTLQIQTVDNTTSTLPPAAKYANQLLSTQAVAMPGRIRLTVLGSPVPVSLSNQGTVPIASSNGSVPRIRFINTSAQGAVSVASTALLTAPAALTTAPVSLLLGPGGILDLAFYQLYLQPVVVQPAETAWPGVVPASAAAPVVVDVLFL